MGLWRTTKIASPDTRKNEADEFDASAAGDDNTKNEAEKVKYEAKGNSFTKDSPKSGSGFNKIMKVYFGGDDYDGHVIEEEVRIDGESKDGTIDNKVTEELPLWVFAFPNPTYNVRRPRNREPQKKREGGR